ncbi:glutamate receptor ionotropic, kainate 2-like, partial [Ruditapes philippinarum]|uniref:glutamate receptor ionotropic, kainate 2-like n=1 Tax=Ruditapes philippinarum TaxID=129788 RepID=UPI00295A891C
SPWIKYISKEIVNLQQQQVISKLYKKWWVEKSNTVCEDDNADDQQTSALGVGNLGGVFLVLAGGSIFALFVAILEFLWKAGKTARKQNVSFLTEVKNGLYFIFVECTSSRNMGEENSSVDECEVNKNSLQKTPKITNGNFCKDAAD